jgi:hypothetical protein
VAQYNYANNHYRGFEPATVELFRELCREKGSETPFNITLPTIVDGFLFDVSKN